MTGVDELLTWLRQQLDEDERMARAAADLAKTADWWASAEGRVHDANAPGCRNLLGGEYAWSLDDIGAHIARWDPARVLAKVKADRRILEIHHHIECKHDNYGPSGDCAECGNEYPCETVHLLAQAYAGQPGWREEWRIDV